MKTTVRLLEIDEVFDFNSRGRLTFKLEQSKLEASYVCYFDEVTDNLLFIKKYQDSLTFEELTRIHCRKIKQLLLVFD